MTSVQLLYVYTFLTSAFLHVPVVVLYYRDILHIGFTEFLVAEALFSAIVLMGELPSGLLSDIWRRKYVLALGTFFIGLGLVIMAVGYPFLGGLLTALIGQGVIGIGMSLQSGTMQSYLYDYLAEHHKQDLFERIERKRHGISMFAIAFGGVSSGFIYHFLGPYIPLMIDIVLFGVAILCILCLPEPMRVKQAIRQSPLSDIVQTAKYALHGHREVAQIIIASAVLFAAGKVALWSQQPYYIAIEIPDYLFGVLFAAGAFIGALGSNYGHMLDKYIRHKDVLWLCMAILVGALCVSNLFPSIWMVPALLLPSMIWGFCNPHVQAALNNRISSERRATILSTASLSVHILFIPLSIGIGVLSDATTIHTGLLVLAGILAVMGLVAKFSTRSYSHHQ